MRKLILLFFIIFLGINAKAQHPEILGSHISYRAIDTLTYEVKLTVIRECSGDLSALNDTLILKTDSLIIKQKPTFVSKKDITTSGKNCPNKSICAGGTLPYGFEERIYMDTFSLFNINACDIYFIWTGNKRYSKMTTTNPSENHYNFAYLNYCATKYNNSHAYSSIPKILTSSGNDLKMGIRLVDTLEINDSINNSLVNILSDDTTKIKYKAPYTYRMIFTFLGGFREGLKFPAGFHFDSIYFDFISRPMKVGEITSYCVESNEFRKINGTTYKIGTTRWDMTLIVDSSKNNRTPDVREPTNDYSFKLCTGNSTFVNLNSLDADTSDTTQIILDYSGYKNITETYYNSNKLVSSKIEWAAKPDQLRTIKSPYIINAKVIDNACDIQGNNSVNIGFYIGESPDTNFFKIDKQITQCNVVKWIINRKKKYPTKKTIWYENESKISLENKDTITVKYDKKGWKKIALTIQSDIGCENIFLDSIFLDSVPEFEFYFVSNDTVCKGANHEFKVNILDGKSPFNILWNDNDTANNKIIKTDSTVFYKVKITDKNGCFLEDSIVLIVLNPILKTQNISGCFGDSLTVSAKIENQNNIKTTFIWNNILVSDSFKIYAKNDTSYYVKANFGNYCSFNDSLKITVNSLPIFNINDSVFCINDNPTLALNFLDANNIKNVIWNDIFTSNTYKISTDKIPTTVKIKVTTLNNCSKIKFQKLELFPYKHEFSLKDSMFCNNISSAKLSLNITQPNSIKNIIWNETTDADTFLVTQIPSSINIKIIDTFDCSFSVEKYVDTFSKINIVVISQDSICFNSNPIVLKANPKGGIWKSNAVIDSMFYPSKKDSGNHKLQYVYTDKNGCSDSAITNMFVNFIPEPQILINPNIDKGVIPLTVYFYESSFYPYETYLWEFFNGKRYYKARTNNDKVVIFDTGYYDLKLTVTKNGCTVFSEIKNRILVLSQYPASLKNMPKNIEILIYPNPAKSVLSIDLKELNTHISYKILDINGKEILAGNLENLQNNIDINLLSSGLYFVEIYQGNILVFRTKIIKE